MKKFNIKSPETVKLRNYSWSTIKINCNLAKTFFKQNNGLCTIFLLSQKIIA